MLIILNKIKNLFMKKNQRKLNESKLWNKSLITNERVSYIDWINNCEKLNIENAINEIKKNTDFTIGQITFSVFISVDEDMLSDFSSVFESVYFQEQCNLEIFLVGTQDFLNKISNYVSKLDASRHVEYRALSINQSFFQTINKEIKNISGKYFLTINQKVILKPGIFTLTEHYLQRFNWPFIAYSDHDYIDDLGNRSQPNFKCDANKFLLLSKNYIGDFVFFSKKDFSDFEEPGGHGSIYRYLLDLILCSESRILHIPHILYSVISDNDQAKKSEIKVVVDCLEKNNIQCIVTPNPFHSNARKLQYGLPISQPLVSILIPIRDKVNLLKKCIESIKTKSSYLNYEIIVIDNGSCENDTKIYLNEIKLQGVMVVVDEGPFNFSRINNYGASFSKGDFLLFLNNDIEVISSDWIEELLSFAVQRDVGCVGAKLYYPDNTIQHGGVILGIGGIAGHAHKHFKRDEEGYEGRLFLQQELSAVTAACMMVRKELFQTVSGFDEIFSRAYNDVDLCLRISQLGFRNVWTPFAELYHYESKSRGYDESEELIAINEIERQLMRERWAGKLTEDPFYSQNLSLELEDFSLRF